MTRVSSLEAPKSGGASQTLHGVEMKHSAKVSVFVARLNHRLVSSTGLIMWIDHRKEIRKLTFRALALRRSESIRSASGSAGMYCIQVWSHHTIPDQPALASGYPQNRIQDGNASSQMYLRCRTTVSFRLDKNQRELAVSVEIIPGHTSNGQYL